MAIKRTLKNCLEYDDETGQLIFNHRNRTANMKTAVKFRRMADAYKGRQKSKKGD